MAAVAAAVPATAAGLAQASGACETAREGTARQLHGVVRDSSGGVIPGAQVTASCGGQRVAATTGGDGSFRLDVTRGPWLVLVSVPGFQPVEQHVLVEEDDVVRDISLTPAAIIDAVTVVAAPAVATRDGAGTKTDTPLVEVPQVVNVVTSDEMAARGYPRTVSEALQYTPGFYNADVVDSRYDYGTQVRGFFAANYVDGLFMQTGADRAAAQFEPYGMERLEVLKGPSSVLYGQNAPGGLINRVSKRPRPFARHEATVQAGSFDRFQGAFDTTGPIGASSTLAYRLVGLVRRSDTQVDYVEDNRVFVAPSVSWTPRAGTRLTVLTHYQRDSGGEFGTGYLPEAGTREPSQYGTIPVGRFLGDPDFRDYDRSQYSLGYALEQRVGRWMVSQNLRFLAVDVKYANLVFPSLREDGRTVDRTVYAFDEDIYAPSVDTNVRGTVDTGTVRHTLLGGIDMRWGKDRNVSAYYGNAAPPLDIFAPDYSVPTPDLPMNGTGRIDDRQIGVYVQDQVDIDKLVLTLGVRHDSTRSDLDYGPSFQEVSEAGAMTGRVGANYVLPSGLAPFVSVATSFQPTTGLDFAGTPFEPTTGRQIEGGVKYQPRTLTGLLSASVFDLRQQNVLTQDPDPTHLCGGFSCSIQVGEARVRGVELEGKMTPWRGIDVIAGYTWLDAVYTRSNDGFEGNNMQDVPQQQWSLWLDYTKARGVLAGLSLAGGLRYTGRVFGDTLNLWNNDPITMADAAVRYRVGRAQVAVNLSNLTDKTTVYCADYGCAYGARRNISTTVSYEWR